MRSKRQRSGRASWAKISCASYRGAMDFSGMQLALEGAPKEQLDRLQLPREGRDFLEKHDGARGTVGPRNRPVGTWSAEQIAREAGAPQVTQAPAGLLRFGRNGGAHA